VVDQNHPGRYLLGEEITLAVEKDVIDAYGIEEDQIPPAVFHLLGFRRVTEVMRASVESVIAGMIRRGRLTQQGVYLEVKTQRAQNTTSG
jgi:hypothetical protein